MRFTFIVTRYSVQENKPSVYKDEIAFSLNPNGYKELKLI